MADSGGGPSEGKPATLGFKLAAGKARPKVAVGVQPKEAERRELITGVSGSGVIQAAEAQPDAPDARVIAPLQNTYKAGVGKFVPSFVPEASVAAITGSSEDRYERAAVGEAPKLTSFGLEVRGPRDAPAGSARSEAGARPLVPLSRADEAAQLKADLEALPEGASVEDYEALPVEDFGKALLRGLGWADGQGVGRKRQVVEPKQTVRRPDRLGLGANPAAPPPDTRPRKMGDKPRQDLVAAPTADGITRHRVGLDEALVPRASLAPGPAPGKAMAVVGGRHAGVRCIVRELLPGAGGGGPGAGGGGLGERVRVELQPSGEVVDVAAEHLAERGSEPSQPPQQQPLQQQQAEQQPRSDGSRDGRRERSSERRQQQQQQQGGGGGGSSSRQRSRSRNRQRDGRRERSRERSRERRPEPSSSRGQQQQQQAARPPAPRKLWVASLIRVRVVDKRLAGGRLYLKKGVVLDVAPDGTCELRLDEGHQVVAAHQEQLETVVPRAPGAAALVVAGEHKGRRGRLLQASVSSGAAALQLVGDMAVVRLGLDDLAEYVGGLEEEDE